MAINYSLRMCARHVDSTNPGRSNLVFRSKPIPEADMSNRLIAETGSRRMCGDPVMTDAWSLKPFLTLSSVIMSVTLGSSLTKNLTFQHTLINLPIVATSPAAYCFPFPIS